MADEQIKQAPKPEDKKPAPLVQTLVQASDPKLDSKQEKMFEGVKKAELKGDVKKIDRLIDGLRRRSMSLAAGNVKQPPTPLKLPVQELKTIVEIRDISIVIDTYDDIFSDFDPRPYSQRALSDDFLKEIRARYRENRIGGVEVHFIMPEKLRDLKVETMVKKRIREHFAYEIKTLGEGLGKLRQRGMIYTLVGACLLGVQAGLEIIMGLTMPQTQFLSIFFVPAGWYGMFNGIEKLIETPYDMATNLRIAIKFEKADYIFISQSASASPQQHQ